MRFIFKTDYAQDIKLAKHSGHVFWYGLLILLLIAAPWIIAEYWLAQLTFILIYAIAGLGLMLLAGFTGQFSMGHAAFLGVGAYTQAVFTNMGVPFPVALALAGTLSAAVGVVVGLPALRVKGIYLGIATISFGFIVEEVFARWESVTGGNSGIHIKAPDIFGWKLSSGIEFYLLCLFITVVVTLGILNLLRSSTGRAFVAIRDSEISAQSMGIHLARYKTLSFSISAALAGVAGALYAHKLQFISPDQFNILQSIDLLLLVVIGGLGSVHGAFLGAIFLIAMPQLIALSKDYLPAVIGQAPGLQSVVYGAVLIAFVTVGLVRALVEDSHVFANLPVLPQRHVQAAKIIPEIGQTEMTDLLLSAKNLSVRFGGVLAVNNVSFDVKQGEVFTLIGPNGAGKTTVFNLISRIYTPTSGEITYLGKKLTDQAPHNIAALGIARTFQNIELFEHATVMHNLLIGGHTHKKTGFWSEVFFTPKTFKAEVEAREKAEKIIEFLDLQHHRDSLVAGLPYGVRKVVEMGRALCTEPKLLLLDEPSSGLNVEETDDMAFWIQDIKHELGITVLMVEHDMSLVSKVSDRVVAMNQGAVLAMGTPREVQNDPGVIEAYLGSIDDVSSLRRAA